MFLSFMEDDYAIILLVKKHIVQMRMTLDRLGIPQKDPTPPCYDNQTTIKLIHNHLDHYTFKYVHNSMHNIYNL
jgi:hypothetical protein